MRRTEIYDMESTFYHNWALRTSINSYVKKYLNI